MSVDLPPRRKVVSSQASTSSPSTSTTQPRARAKVDLSSLATPPPAPQRPSIRSTPSSVSLRSGVSSTAGSSRTPLASPLLNPPSQARLSSPALTPTHTRSPPVPLFPQRPPSRSEHSKSTPAIRARATPIQRSTTSQTPIRSFNATSSASTTDPPRAGPSTGQSVVDRGRAKVKPSIPVLTPTHQSRSVSRSRSGLSISPGSSSPALIHDNRSDIGHGYLHEEPIQMERVTSHHSSPGRSPHAILPPHMYSAIDYIVQHPTASCPSSPPLRPSEQQYRQPPRSLPLNPNTTLTSFFPATPLSPEMKTISLPLLTPRRTSESSDVPDDRRTSGTGSQHSGVNETIMDLRRLSSEGDRWSGSTAVERDGDTLLGKSFGGEARVVQQALDEEAEEAKVNRKVADLEISNASLMAINRSLEATKAKQRAEILKLRRALRESMDGTGSHRPLLSPLALLSPSAEDPEYGGISDEEDEMEGPELELRWDKIQDLIGAMQRRGEAAVVRGKEDIKIAAQRVLDWTQVEDGDQSVEETGPGTGAGTPEVDTPEG